MEEYTDYDEYDERIHISSESASMSRALDSNVEKKEIGYDMK